MLAEFYNYAFCAQFSHFKCHCGGHGAKDSPTNLLDPDLKKFNTTCLMYQAILKETTSDHLS
jgi:hypothetical protein